MISYLETLKITPAHTKLELINDSVQFQGKISKQKSVAFLYTSNEQTRNIIEKTIPFTIVLKRLKYLGINVTLSKSHWWRSFETRERGCLYILNAAKCHLIVYVKMVNRVLFRQYPACFSFLFPPKMLLLKFSDITLKEFFSEHLYAYHWDSIHYHFTVLFFTVLYH